MKIKGILKIVYRWMAKVTGIRLYLLVSDVIGVRPYPYERRDLLKNAADFKKVRASLVMNQKWVPYPAYKDRAGWDDFLGDYKDDYIRKGEDCLGYEWKVIKATDYMEFGRSGDQAVMEIPYGENRTALEYLFLAEMAEGGGRFIDQIINGVFYCCEMTTWALSAHLWNQKDGGYLPSHKEHIIEMGSGGLASLLAWIYYYLSPSFDKVNPMISNRLLYELRTRILDTYMGTDRFRWMAFTPIPTEHINNWTPWNNFYVLQCFFLIETDRDRLAEAVCRTMVSMDHFINYNFDDGACEEGTFYWEYAAGKLYDYLQLLYDGTAGAVSIFDSHILRNMGEYMVRSYVGDGWLVSFADSTAIGHIDVDMIFRYGKAVKSREMMHFASYLKGLPAKREVPQGDIFRLLQTLLYRNELTGTDEPPEKPPYTWYPKTEICYMANNAEFFVAAKGGYNGESHNHNDVGSFALYINSIPVFLDAGVGTYTRKTFSSERYSIWTMRSEYHNIPVINGVSQGVGRSYRAKDTVFDSVNMCFSVNIAEAYPREANVKIWTRSYRLSDGSLQINDRFSLSKACSPNRVVFLTWGMVDISEPGIVTVDIKGIKALLMYDKDIFSPVVEPVLIDDPRLYNIWGRKIYRVILVARRQTLFGSYSYTVVSEKKKCD